MPPLLGLSSRSRTAARSAAVPTLLSITKLLRLLPSAFTASVSSVKTHFASKGTYGEWGLMEKAVSSAKTHIASKRAYGEWGLMELATLSAEIAKKEPEAPEDPPGSPQFVWKLLLSVCLVLLGGVFAGLTLALMGSDDLNLRVLSQSSDDPQERKSAAKVLKLLSRGRHWVLVVLLLSNVIVNESLPIFLDDVLGGGVAAVIVSTTMIVIFGEIIPQAVCVRYGLRIGGVCAPFVLGMMYLFYPIAYPIAKLLDRILGKDEGHTYKKAELKSFLQFHREGEEPLRDDEIAILNGVLSLNDKHVQTIMTPISDCLILPSDKILDHEAIDQILLSGFSRIPIHEPGQKDNFTGMLLVKRLITYNPEDGHPVSKFPLLPLPEAKPSINCFQALDYFQTGRAHLLLISNTPGQRGGALGIVSLEDLIEEIIGEEIIDETDRFQDNHSKKQAVRKGTAGIMKGIIERNRVINAFSRRPSHNGTTPSGQAQVENPSTDGLLIQIENGALIAEPLKTVAHEEHEGQKLVVGEVDTNPGKPITEETVQAGGQVSDVVKLGLAAAAIGADIKRPGSADQKSIPERMMSVNGKEALTYKDQMKKDGKAGTSRENLLDDHEE